MRTALHVVGKIGKVQLHDRDACGVRLVSTSYKICSELQQIKPTPRCSLVASGPDRRSAAQFLGGVQRAQEKREEIDRQSESRKAIVRPFQRRKRYASDLRGMTTPKSMLPLLCLRRRGHRLQNQSSDERRNRQGGPWDQGGKTHLGEMLERRVRPSPPMRHLVKASGGILPIGSFGAKSTVWRLSSLIL